MNYGKFKGKEIALYKGEELLCIGTVDECAKELGIQPDTVKFYFTDTYKKRRSARKNPNKSMNGVFLD